MSTGCSTTAEKLTTDTVTRTVAKAPTIIPKTPDYCKEHVPDVTPVEGEKWRHVQFRWEVVRDQFNARIDWCAADRDKSASYAAGSQTP